MVSYDNYAAKMDRQRQEQRLTLRRKLLGIIPRKQLDSMAGNASRPWLKSRNELVEWHLVNWNNETTEKLLSYVDKAL